MSNLKFFLNNGDHLWEAGDNFCKMINGKPKNINPLTSIPEPQKTLFTSNGVDFFERKEDLLEKSRESDVVYAVEYLGDVAGRSDVIRETHIGTIENGVFKEKSGDELKSVMLCARDTEGIGSYNEKRSIYTGEFTWEFEEGGSLSDVYAAFEKHGITLVNNVYDREAKIMEMVKKLGLFRDHGGY